MFFWRFMRYLRSFAGPSFGVTQIGVKVFINLLLFTRNTIRLPTVSGTENRYRLHGLFFIASGVGLSPLYCGHFWPIVPAPDDRWGWLCSNWWNEDSQWKPKYSEKTCPSATLSTTNSTWPDPGSNPGRHGGKPATNPLSYGATLHALGLNTTGTLHVRAEIKLENVQQTADRGRLPYQMQLRRTVLGNDM
jgi:hypothetical protein